MNILFLQPTYYQDADKKEIYTIVPPLGLATLASIAKCKNHRVKLFDIMGRESEVKEIINKFKPDLICITCLTTYYPEFVKLIKFIRIEIGYDKMIVAGGSHITLEPEKTINQTDIDICFIGEADESFKEFLELMANKKRNFESIKGLYLKNYGFTGKRDLMVNLEQVFMPAYEEIEFDKYTTSSIFVECARGCPYNCIYCSSKFIYGNSLRWMSPEKVVNNIEYLRKKFNFKEFSPLADTFVCNIKWLEKFCKLLAEKNLKMTYRCNGRINLMTDKIFDLLKLSGCTEVDYGIESAVGIVLKNINKAINEENLEKVIKKTFDYGFKIHLYFMLSLPGETEEDINTTIRFAKEMKKKYNCSTEFQITRIYPGTPLSELVKLNIDDWSKTREPYLPYSNVPAYYELDKKIIFQKMA